MINWVKCILKSIKIALAAPPWSSAGCYAWVMATVHEWSTFVDDTQTGWDQTLAPVLEAAIDLLSIQGLLPEKVTVK